MASPAVDVERTELRMHGYVLEPGEPEQSSTHVSEYEPTAWRPRQGGSVLYKAMNSQTKGKYAIRIVDGSDEPEHTHQYEDECVCLLDDRGGSFLLTVGGVLVRAQVRQLIFLPKLIRHATRFIKDPANSAEDAVRARRIVVGSPTGERGLEAYLQSTAHLYDSGPPPKRWDPVMVEAQEKNGIRYSDPEMDDWLRATNTGYKSLPPSPPHFVPGYGDVGSGPLRMGSDEQCTVQLYVNHNGEVPVPSEQDRETLSLYMIDGTARITRSRHGGPEDQNDLNPGHFVHVEEGVTVHLSAAQATILQVFSL